MKLTSTSKETFALSSLGSLLILLNSLPAFRYYFFAEDFVYLRIYNLHHQQLLKAAFSPQGGIFFRPGFFLASLVWHFVLPPEPMYYHLRNFAFCVVSLVLLHRVLLKVVLSRTARVIALLLFASSKMFLTIIGYINAYETSVLLIAGLLTVLFWLRYIENRRALDYALALTFCLICCFTKDNGVAVIGLMAACVISLAPKPDDVIGEARYWATRYLPAVVIAAVYLTLRYFLTGPISTENAVYSPRLSLSNAIWQTKGFLATVGNLTLTNPGQMGKSGLSGLLTGGSTAIEAILCTALWGLILLTLWQGLSAGRRLILPAIWIALYLSPIFLIRNHQVYYYQDSLLGFVLLIGICLDRVRLPLVVVWCLVVAVVGINGFVSNRRSYYDWQYSADYVEQLKPKFEDWRRNNPPASVTYVSPPELIDLTRWTLEDPLTQHLTGKAISVHVIKASEQVPPNSLPIKLYNILATSSVATTTASGTISASPNPIQECGGTGLAITTISWTFRGAKKVEVRVGKPDGDMFAGGKAPGQVTTGKWVTKGMGFYLQDVSDGRPLTPENTIAMIRVGVIDAGCR